MSSHDRLDNKDIQCQAELWIITWTRVVVPMRRDGLRPYATYKPDGARTACLIVLTRAVRRRRRQFVGAFAADFC